MRLRCQDPQAAPQMYRLPEEAEEEMTNKPLDEPLPENIVRRKNGVLQDVTTGRFVKGGMPTTAIASPSQGRELAERRYEKTRQAVRERVLAEVRGFGDLPSDTPEDAFAFVVAKQTLALVDSDKPRLDDVEKLGQIMDVLPRKQAEQAQEQGRPQVDAPIMLILAQLQRRDDVIDVIPMRTDLVDGESE